MNFQRLLKKPRTALRDSDSWVRLQALSAIARQPLAEDRSFLEELLESGDLSVSLLAYKGLSRLFPMPVGMEEVWQSIFLDSIDLLEKRASSGSGSSQIRAGSVKALAFVTNLSFNSVEAVLKSLSSSFRYDTSFVSREPLLPLISRENEASLHEAFGALLGSLSTEHQATAKILTRELDCQNPDRLIPALIALQLNPNPDFTDQLLWLARNSEKAVADEAVKALLACGGKKVCLVISSLMKEIKDSERRQVLLSVAASSDREEMWPILVAFAKGKEQKLILTALRAVDGFDGVDKSKKLALYSEAVKCKDPEVMALASVLAWKAGSVKTVKLLNQFMDSDSEAYRMIAAGYLSEVSSETAIPILISHYSDELDEKISNQILLSLRKLLPSVKKTELVENTILPWLERMFKSSDDSKRNQTAVLCGCLGPSAEDLLIKFLACEKHDYVIASILSALGKCGCRRILLLSKYHDHEDDRIRANMIEALANCGNEAIPYLSEALNDCCPRVRANASYSLFMLGQLNAISAINNMLQVPEPVSVLSACHALYNIFKTVLPKLEADHPLALSISRFAIDSSKKSNKDNGPGLLNNPEAVTLFNEMASASGDRKKILWILEERHKRRPSSFLTTRLLGAHYILAGENKKAFPLMEICARENQSDLADLLDAYRTALRLGNLEKAKDLGEKTKKLYKMLLDGCIEICRNLNGTGVTLMLQRLNFLEEPSMNLYNVMIQLKVIECDNETVMYLMTELILSRPYNCGLINKLVSIMPDEFNTLRDALSLYAKSIADS